MIYTIDKSESNRITCLRALCVGMVIFLHQYAGALGDTAFVATGSIVSSPILEAVQYIISRIITFAAVPLFFLISSVLLYAKEFTWKSNMKKKLKSLILPYALWITIYILIYFTGQTLPATASYFANAGRQVREMGIPDFIGAFTGVGGHGIFVNALWFLRDLIILNLLAPIIKILIDRFPGTIFMLLMILWNMGHVPGILLLNTQSVVFFCLGYFVVKYGLRIKQLDMVFNMGEALPIFIILIAIEYYFYVTDNSLRVAAHSFSVITGIFLLIRLSGYFCKNNHVPKALALLAEYSFFVYASSDFVQTVLKKISGKLLPGTDWAQIAAYFIIPFAVCGSCVLVGFILGKILPPLYNILTGSRKSRSISGN